MTEKTRTCNRQDKIIQNHAFSSPKRLHIITKTHIRSAINWQTIINSSIVFFYKHDWYLQTFCKMLLHFIGKVKYKNKKLFFFVFFSITLLCPNHFIYPYTLGFINLNINNKKHHVQFPINNHCMNVLINQVPNLNY